ncbi:MAG: hypothetical protein WBM96_09935 [Polyangiales bacterium]
MVASFAPPLLGQRANQIAMQSFEEIPHCGSLSSLLIAHFSQRTFGAFQRTANGRFLNQHVDTIVAGVEHPRADGDNRLAFVVDAVVQDTRN